MKNIYLFFALTVLCACAGTPPRWWNPSGNYENTGAAQPSAVPVSLPASPAKEEEDPANLEQSFEPAADGYEELTLSPYSHDDDTAAEDFSAPQQAPAPAQQKAQKLEKRDKPSASSGPAKVEERLPEDGSLPPPSVLESI